MPTFCNHNGCTKRSTYGTPGTKKAELCAEYALDGMVNVKTKKCGHSGCVKQPSYGTPGTKKAELCAEHALDGMVNVKTKKCGHSGCVKQPSYGNPGTKKWERCAEHAEDGMVDVVHRKCGHSGCAKQPTYGIPGTKKAGLCAEHAEAGMMNLVSRRCGHSGCSKYPSFGVVGGSARVFCAQHAKDGMTNLSGRRPHPNRQGKRGGEGEREGSIGDNAADDVERASREKRKCHPPAPWRAAEPAENSPAEVGGVMARSERACVGLETQLAPPPDEARGIRGAGGDGPATGKELRAFEQDGCVKTELATLCKNELSEG